MSAGICLGCGGKLKDKDLRCRRCGRRNRFYVKAALKLGKKNARKRAIKNARAAIYKSGPGGLYRAQRSDFWSGVAGERWGTAWNRDDAERALLARYASDPDPATRAVAEELLRQR